MVAASAADTARLVRFGDTLRTTPLAEKLLATRALPPDLRLATLS